MSKVEIANASPEWKQRFVGISKVIKGVFGPNCVAVHHIGSTAVKGLCAVPVIDVLLVVKDLLLAKTKRAEWEAIGYELAEACDGAHDSFFIQSAEVHIRVLEKSNQKGIDRLLAVRDYLRTHPQEMGEYAQLKWRLAAECAFDREGYGNGKRAFLQALEEKALAYKKQTERQGFCMALGMCFGSCFGACLGIALGNIGIGMCFGVAIGMSVGLAVGAYKKK